MRCARTFSFFGRFDKVLAVRKSPETNGEAEKRERILHFSFKKVNPFEFGDELSVNSKSYFNSRKRSGNTFRNDVALSNNGNSFKNWQ